MKQDVDLHEFDRESVPNNALRVYGDVMDDFPVLKAFQQYIDAEQAKARKRLLSLGIFFGILTGAIIAVFVVMLMVVTSRNQQLNDRLVEYAMKDRDRVAPVVVQPQENAIIAALTAKLDALQTKLDENQAKAEKEAAIAAERVRIAKLEASAKPKGPSPEELEIQRLNALLATEREKAREQIHAAQARAAAEKELRKQEELEAYRRKHYPELYGLPKVPSVNRHGNNASTPSNKRNGLLLNDAGDDEEILPDDENAIDYFNDGEDDVPHSRTKPPSKVNKSPLKSSSRKINNPPSEANTIEQKAPESPAYVIPVEVKGKNSSFRIPL